MERSARGGWAFVLRNEAWEARLEIKVAACEAALCSLLLLLLQLYLYASLAMVRVRTGAVFSTTGFEGPSDYNKRRF
jgi:hypothetical protein